MNSFFVLDSTIGVKEVFAICPNPKIQLSQTESFILFYLTAGFCNPSQSGIISEICIVSQEISVIIHAFVNSCDKNSFETTGIYLRRNKSLEKSSICIDKSFLVTRSDFRWQKITCVFIRDQETRLPHNPSSSWIFCGIYYSKELKLEL